MRKRSGRGLLCLAGAAFLLLILSALIEAPVPNEVNEENQNPVGILCPAEFLPCTVPAADDSIAIPFSSGYGFAVLMIASALIALPKCAGHLDANGRWVHQKRYVLSVYQVFRQELAGG